MTQNAKAEMQTMSNDSLHHIINKIAGTLDKVDSPLLSMHFYYLKLNFFDKKNQSDSALFYARKYYRLKIDLQKSAADDYLQELMTIEEVRQKQHRIQQLASENLLVKSENRRFKNLTIFSLLLLFLVLVLIVVIRRNWKNKYTIAVQKKNLDKMEILNITLEKQKLGQEIELQKREAMMEALKLTEHEKIMTSIDSLLEKKLSNHNLSKETEVALLDISNEIRIKPFEKEFESFKLKFNNMHPGFVKKLSSAYPKLTDNDLNMAAGLIIGLTNFELSKIFNVHVASIRKSKYRLKQKLDLPASQDLKEFLVSFA